MLDDRATAAVGLTVEARDTDATKVPVVKVESKGVGLTVEAIDADATKVPVVKVESNGEPGPAVATETGTRDQTTTDDAVEKVLVTKVEVAEGFLLDHTAMVSTQ